MKRMIKASKYAGEASNSLNKIRILGNILSRVADASEESEIELIMSELGGLYKSYTQQDQAIKAIMDTLGFVTSDYLSDMNRDQKLPEVRDTIVDYLKGLGYDMTKMSNPPRGYDESYVIIPADECDSQDVKTVASAVAHDFGLRPDTGVIGGSWTSYEFKMDGVPFRIGFEDDRDFDPSGKEVSLQFYL